MQYNIAHTSANEFPCSFFNVRGLINRISEGIRLHCYFKYRDQERAYPGFSVVALRDQATPCCTLSRGSMENYIQQGSGKSKRDETSSEPQSHKQKYQPFILAVQPHETSEIKFQS